MSHGHWNGGVRSSTYISWANMLQRCFNEQHPRYLDYGGRGIVVCDKWFSFEGFLEDMGIKPERVEVISLERKDNSKGYNKDNCYWATAAEQSLNKRLYKNNKLQQRNISNHHGRFRVEFRRNTKLIIIGSYSILEEAIIARDKFLQEEKNVS